MVDQIHRAAALLPNGPWSASATQAERPTAVRALEWGTLAVGMSSLFMFGLQLGSDGEFNAMPFGVGLIASAAVFVAPDALQRRIERATQLLQYQRRNRTYSEETLYAQWPARRTDDAPQTREREERVA